MCHKNVSLTQEVSGRDQLQSLFLIIHQPLCPAVPLRLVNIREDVSLPPAVPSQHPPFTVKTGSGWTFQRSNYHLVWFTCESSYLHQPPASNLPFTKSIRMHLHLDILLYKPEDICDVMSSLGGISHMSHHTVKPILPLGRAWCHLKGRRSSIIITDWLGNFNLLQLDKFQGWHWAWPRESREWSRRARAQQLFSNPPPPPKLSKAA